MLELFLLTLLIAGGSVCAGTPLAFSTLFRLASRIHSSRLSAYNPLPSLCGRYVFGWCLLSLLLIAGWSSSGAFPGTIIGSLQSSAG